MNTNEKNENRINKVIIRINENNTITHYTTDSKEDIEAFCKKNGYEIVLWYGNCKIICDKYTDKFELCNNNNNNKLNLKKFFKVTKKYIVQSISFIKETMIINTSVKKGNKKNEMGC